MSARPLLSYPRIPQTWIRSSLEVILPTQCLICSRPLRGMRICYRCRPTLPDLRGILNHRCHCCFSPRMSEEPICETCKLFPGLADSTRFLWEYDGLARDYIRIMKYRPSLQLLDLASSLLSQASQSMFPGQEWDIVVPVPSAAATFRKRLLHPCRELARKTGHDRKIPIENVLVHDKRRLPQASLPHEERLRRLFQLFSVRSPADVRNMRVLLVEDVITTGATITAATFRLKEAGACRVDVLALARTRVWSRFRHRISRIFR
jgi:predicted amidophosphoribosyltransferase